MNSERYFSIVEERLNTLSVRVERLGRLNLHDININAEYFFMHLLNLLFKRHLTNINSQTPNAPGVDLADYEKKEIWQVSSTATFEKIQQSISKVDMSQYHEYRFKFLSISKDCDKLRKRQYAIPEGLVFEPSNDIIDITYILRKFQTLTATEQKHISKLVEVNLKPEIKPEQRIKGFGLIIKLLSELGTLDESHQKYDVKEFEIAEKIRKNDLTDLENRFEELGAFLGDVQRIYEMYDELGSNKSRAVLYSINKVYLNLKKEMTGTSLMEAIADSIYRKLDGTEELRDFYEEDIKYYIDIILVDAFIRCKIFENPNR